MPADEIVARAEPVSVAPESAGLPAPAVSIPLAPVPDARPEAPLLRENPGVWLTLLLLLDLGVPFLPVPSEAMALLGAGLVTVIHAVAVVQVAVQMTRQRLPPAKLALWLAISAAWWAVLQWGLVPQVIEPFNHAVAAVGGQPSPHQLLLGHTVRELAKLALLCLAVLGGSLVARLIVSPNMLGPVCAIVALIDIWGVLFGGIVSQLMEKTPQLASTVMIGGPTVGAASSLHQQVPRISQPAIGVGDYLFLGLLFASLHNHRMNWRGAAALVTPLIIMALLAIILYNAPALPGLFFIGLGVALPNLRYFEYTRDEKFALIYAAVFVVILTVALYFGVTSLLPAAAPGK